MRLLVVEDNVAVIMALKRALRNKYVVDSTSSGLEAIHYAEYTEYDAIILDVLLPDKNGLEVCREIRKTKKTPILVLSGIHEASEKISILDEGADDYLVKPFNIEELLARLRALVRRQNGSSSNSILKAADLELDMATRKVSRGGIDIDLRRKEFDLLEYLLHNSGKVVTRSMIIDHVWDMNETIWTNAVDVHIKYLRDKVDRPFQSKLVQTVHGVGYKIVAQETRTATDISAGTGR